MSDPRARQIAEQARRLHIDISVALHRDGVSVPACDGPMCAVCVVLAAALTAAEASPQLLESNGGEKIETITYQANVAARNRPCGAHPCMNEYPGQPSRWCSGCLIAALLAANAKGYEFATEGADQS